MIRTAPAHRLCVLFSLPAAASLLVALAGCVKVEQTLALSRDGSGTIDITYGMSEENAAQMTSFLAEGVRDEAEGLNGAAMASPFDFNDDDVRRDFKEYETDGVVLESVKTETRDGWRYRNLVIRFKNLEGLARTGFLSDQSISLTRDARGNYVFVQSAGPSGTVPEGLPDLAETVDPIASPWLEGFRAVIRIRTPGRILETNAPDHDGQSAAWTFDLDSNPRALQEAQRLSMRVVFEGRGVKIADFKSVDR